MSRVIELGRYDLRHAGRVLPVRRLRSDSRCVEPGDLLVLTGRGDRPTTASRIDDALRRGAVGVIVEDDDGLEHPRVHPVAHLPALIDVLVNDVTGTPSADLHLVGVTGTNGKTSTVQLLSQAWHLLGTPGATIGTLGAGLHGAPRITTGLTTPHVVDLHELLADFRDAGARSVAMEVSSHALQQNRIAGARFDVAVFTNLTRDHLDQHGSMEAYAAEKAKIVDLDGLRSAVLNLDDPFVRTLRPPVWVDVVGTSSRGAADAAVWAEDVRSDGAGVRFDLVLGGHRAAVRSPLLGRFNVDNLLAVAGALHAEGVAPAAVADVLRRLEPVEGRMQRIRNSPADPLVVVDYAHTPDALQQVLETVRAECDGRLTAVFGCTGDRDRGKRALMARISEAIADVVVVTDDDVHHEDGDAIVREILAGFDEPAAVTVERDRADAIRRAVRAAGPGDAVVIAGKGHERFQVVGEQRLPFSDAAVATDALAGRSDAAPAPSV